MSEGILIPRLSETLEPLAWPPRCQRCGSYGAADSGAGSVYQGLTVWREHDDRDQPEAIFVVLCLGCADKAIEPHPRLYARLGRHEPAPGVMAVCRGCCYRSGSRCKSPRLRANGGPGLAFPPPDTTVHLSCRDKQGRRYGRWEQQWSAEPVTCEGFVQLDRPAVGRGFEQKETKATKGSISGQTP